MAMDVDEKQAWSASVARQALRSRRAMGIEVRKDPGSQLISIVFAVSALALLALIVVSVLSAIV